MCVGLPGIAGTSNGQSTTGRKPKDLKEPVLWSERWQLATDWKRAGLYFLSIYLLLSCVYALSLLLPRSFLSLIFFIYILLFESLAAYLYLLSRGKLKVSNCS